MLLALGYGMVLTFMVLIMTKRMSALVALALVPIAFGLLVASPDAIGKMMIEGITKLAPTGVMLTFGILYFSVMTDAGLFDPLIRMIVRVVGHDPLKLLLGTAIMGTLVALDGDGATTYVICITALLPIYRRLGVRLQYMATVLLMSIGIMNIVPWGGPTARAASAMHIDVTEVFVPLIPVMLLGFIYQMGVAAFFGVKERRRLGALAMLSLDHSREPPVDGSVDTRRPFMLIPNLLLTALLLIALIKGLLPLPALFLVATAIALLLNYPKLKDQQARLAAHASNVLAVVSLIFAAGIFTGILAGTGMLKEMSDGLLNVMPTWLGPYMAPATALLSAPATYVLTNDAFYFGVLPILTNTASTYGITAAEMARASLLGQPIHLLSPLVASTYLLVAMLDIEYGDNQRASLLWVFGLVLAMLAAALLLGVIPLIAIP
ncbi:MULTISPECIES: CitMHS family transporter [unclassified Variovorax]|uniref:CitMHS family transporter n=1 Tax=unclassified Variovorax TaxID=663243 RepID=UPI001118A447|nr:citrate:proton symporter [Variovorax sp. KBS0712]TSD57014.1 citrate transporter [Variovorax sp. KBS0712]